MEELRSKGYDYWALGHIHQPEVVSSDPHVVYSGNVQGRHIREAGPRGAMLVSVEDHAVSDLEPFHVDVVRWALVDVGIADCASVDEIHDRVRAEIENVVREQADGRLLACRIVLSGSTAAHDAALGSHENILAEARAVAAGLGEEVAWVEKLKIETTPPSDTVSDPALAETLGDLSLAQQDEGLLDELKRQLGPFVSRLPPQVRDSSESELLQAAKGHDFRKLIELARPYAMAKLAGRQG